MVKVKTKTIGLILVKIVCIGMHSIDCVSRVGIVVHGFLMSSLFSINYPVIGKTAENFMYIISAIKKYRNLTLGILHY